MSLLQLRGFRDKEDQGKQQLERLVALPSHFQRVIYNKTQLTGVN